MRFPSDIGRATITLLLPALLAVLCLSVTRATAETGKADTNAQRFARGLPPLPAKRLLVPNRVRRQMQSPPTQTPARDDSQKSGFALTCNSIGFTNGILRANCLLNDGTGRTRITSRINLDLCVSNNDGQLVAQNNGAYSGSCQDCTLTGGSPSTFFCVCERATIDFQDGTRRSTIELNNLIANNRGQLQCFNNLGSVN